MDVNDDAGCLNARVAWTFIVGTPPGAGSLLQWVEYSASYWSAVRPPSRYIEVRQAGVQRRYRQLELL